MPSFRNIALFDAGTCVAMGLTLMIGAAPLASLTLIPEPILTYAGLVLLPVAAFMAAVGLGRVRSSAGPALVIGGNALWVAASLALIADDWIAPNGFGYAFIGAQAAAVAVLAALELAVLRRSTRAMA